MAVPPLMVPNRFIHRKRPTSGPSKLAHTKMPWIERYLTAKRRRKVRQAGRPHSIL